MEQIETKQESTDLASQVERELSGIDDASKVVLNVDDMFKSKGEEQEGEEQDGGNEKTENLDEDYLDSKFKALYNDISQNQVTDLLEVHNYDGINYEISLDACSVNYNTQEHSCKVIFYNYRKSQPLRGPRMERATIDVTDKETFDYIESNIRSRDFTKIDKLEGLSGVVAAPNNNLDKNDKWDDASKIFDSLKK